MSNPSPLFPGQFYHIYNRGNNRENIFVEERNYAYFMSLYTRYIEPVADTYAYCLLRNHFHLLVRIKTLEESPSQDGHVKAPSQHFSNFFNAYARTINQTYGRTGALFQRPFGRVLVRSQSHLFHLVMYIHRNPQIHGFVEDYGDWPYSSYPEIKDLTDFWKSVRSLRREDVLAWFSGVEGFVRSHREEMQGKEINYLVEEDM